MIAWGKDHQSDLILLYSDKAKKKNGGIESYKTGDSDRDEW